MQASLFDQDDEGTLPTTAPLAARMRPRSLDEFVGQQHLLGEGKVLRRMVESGRLGSMVLWGPPGTGKTSLAGLLARQAGYRGITLSAVSSGISDLRKVLEVARQQLRSGGRTVLVVDEVHRWSKSQQDSLLPAVEDGTIILLGLTTENPSFEVVGPLLSRSRVFPLQPLSLEQVTTLLLRALHEPGRGYGDRSVEFTGEALEHLGAMAGGDARAALNALELAVESTPPGADSVIRISLEVAQEAIQRRAVRYDKGGDEHYDVISAFIKSVRGSDPDAALYWLARMLIAGEDPEFISRRLLILAAEDIGLADPNGIVVAAACAQALQYVGLPEARYHLAMATVYLATAPKSNSLTQYFAVEAAILEEGAGAVPVHLRDASYRGAARLGHGQGYRYPHDFPGHVVAQQYLPDEVRGRRFFTPGDQGYERAIAERLRQWRAGATAERDPRSGPPVHAEEPPTGIDRT